MTPRVLTFFSILIFSFSARGQVISIPSGVLYPGVENYIIVGWENTFNKDLRLKSSKGSLRNVGNGNYVFLIDSLGEVVFTLTNIKAKKDTNWKYIIAEIPLPFALIGNAKDTIIKSNLLAQKGVRTGFSLIGHIICDVNFKVIEFTLTIFRGDTILHNEKTEGPWFSPKIKDAFAALKSGDRIVVSNIVITASHFVNKKIEPLELIVKE